MLLKELRQQLVEYGCKMFDAKLVRDGQGNISVLDDESGYIVITPTAVPYKIRKPEDICVVDRNRKLIEGNYPVTSENALHMVFYQKRQDIRAVVHSHPLYSTAISVIGEAEMPVVLNEAAFFLGAPLPVANYGRPGTEELANVTVEAAGLGVGAIMAHHGLVTVGSSLKNAYDSTLAAEDTAQVIILARAMSGRVVPLDTEEATILRKMYLKKCGY
ncbi:MAG: class II aldolase/adducin family protein [Anaerolineales bacterium]|nr:class II aldolase/adducin family protein [Anaerolineales bacterium]